MISIGLIALLEIFRHQDQRGLQEFNRFGEATSGGLNPLRRPIVVAGLLAEGDPRLLESIRSELTRRATSAARFTATELLLAEDHYSAALKLAGFRRFDGTRTIARAHSGVDTAEDATVVPAAADIYTNLLNQEAYSEVELTKIVRGIGAGQDMIHLAGSDF